MFSPMGEFFECGDSSPHGSESGDKSPHSTFGGLNDHQGRYFYLCNVICRDIMSTSLKTDVKDINWVSGFFTRLKALAYDLVRRSLIFSELRAALAAVTYFLVFLPERVRLFSLAKALYQTRLPISGSLINQWAMAGTPPKCEKWITGQIGWDRYAQGIAHGAISKTLILKSPIGEHEKGVIYIAFENNFINLLQHYDWKGLLDQYFIILASSWSPPDYNAVFALAAAGRRSPVFVGISNDGDYQMYGAFKPFVEPVPLLASDWINGDFYHPVESASRSIDIIMVAGWTRWKNHWMLFKALKKLPSKLRVVLIGQDMDGRSADDVYREAQAFGVAGQIEIKHNAQPEEVAKLLCDSRCSVVLSRREGSSVIVVESFFADTPVIMLKGAHIGSIKYINDSTGRLTTVSRLATTIADVLEHGESFSPRRWASLHTGAEIASQRLNAFFRDYSENHGLPWTRDIQAMCRRPNAIYLHESDNAMMQPAYDDAYQRYGLLVQHHLPSST